MCSLQKRIPVHIKKYPTQFKLQQLFGESLKRDKQFPQLQRHEGSPAAARRYLPRSWQVRGKNAQYSLCCEPDVC